ncbi:potassium channel family protein [Streptomyces flavotricini]|uniref:Potassium channel family protein n=1 Tax=Streptomyces flavotricini TaxID=66888 RepID=A0ABS8EFB7_9ACTN|nr:potassium channel family protein [Streptomyces flavotricini]MCC0099172.1 potassium channel family protein [Streptomyces flavotricini]
MHVAVETPDVAWERRTEIPLFYLSLVFLAGYAVRVLAHAHSLWRDIAAIIVALTWTCFIVDYVVRLVLSRQRPLRFVRRHWLDTVIVILPTLRALRMVKVHDAVMARRRDHPRRSLYPRVITYAGLSSLLLGFSGSLGLYDSERRNPQSPIQTFGDSVWCVVQTLTTVGYGDVAPVTVSGRLIATTLMIFGLGLLGAVTGSFSSWLIQIFRRDDEEGPPGEESSPGAPH